MKCVLWLVKYKSSIAARLQMLVVKYCCFLPAALAEAGLEITFQVGPSVRHGQLSPAGEVETFVHLPRQIWRGR